MTVSRPALAIVLTGAALVGAWFASTGGLHAQQPNGFRNLGVARPHHVADWMLQPISLPFDKATSLEDVVTYLRKELKINVVLDPASLDRLDLTPKSTVRLVVENVRLKTGLKLLFDQVGLTTQILPEDNLLLIADKTESDAPLDRVLEEIKAIHRDIHGLQDDFRDLRDSILPAGDDPQPRMRNPTIIEEKPDRGSDGKADGTKKSEKSARARPGV